MDNPIQKTNKEFKEEKKKGFEPPKATDLGGKEITHERLKDKDLDAVSGGTDIAVDGDLCLGGG